MAVMCMLCCFLAAASVLCVEAEAARAPDGVAVLAAAAGGRRGLLARQKQARCVQAKSQCLTDSAAPLLSLHLQTTSAVTSLSLAATKTASQLCMFTAGIKVPLCGAA